MNIFQQKNKKNKKKNPVPKNQSTHPKNPVPKNQKTQFQKIKNPVLVKVFKVVELPSTMSCDLYLKSVVPIAALYSLSLWFS